MRKAKWLSIPEKIESRLNMKAQNRKIVIPPSTRITCPVE